jgi:GxxExxY protein
MDTDESRFNHLTETIIGCAYKVANTLGCGFLEKCYENALAYELAKAGLRVQQQVELNVWYEEIVVGVYIADLVVNDTILVELKAIEHLDDIHSAQGINYLAATGLPLCLLINFGRRVEVKRLAGPALRHTPEP